jgi:hypothetical protein
MHKDKISQIQKEMGDKNHINSFNFINGILEMSCNNNENSTAFIIKLIVLFFIVLGLLGPFANAFMINESSLVLTNLFAIFFYIISLIGLYGKCTCMCFYRPCNWIFTMMIFDFLCIAANLIIIISIQTFDNDKRQKMDNYVFSIICSSFNIIVNISILISHCNIYGALRDVYKRSREYEINIIKKCVNNLIDEIKNN